jgi:sec-independent protein translocase protein TatA
MFNLGPKELIILAVLIVFVFGAKKIPELSKGIADGIRQLRGAFKDEDKK